MAEGELSNTVEEGDYNSLIRIMGHLMAVKERQTNTDKMFEPLKHTIELLKTYEQELPEEVYKQLEVHWVFILKFIDIVFLLLGILIYASSLCVLPVQI